MSRVAVDFGTGNTVVARLGDGSTAPETLAVPGVTMEARGSGAPGARPTHVAPSLIHYGEGETLIGAQVLERGLADHPHTLRWMKRGIAYGATRRRKTAQGQKSPHDGGTDFLKLLLTYLSDSISLERDEIVLTAPVEAFENFRDWLAGLAGSLGAKRVRFLDEATAAVFGYQQAVRPADRFLVVDFGCGTLDVSAVRIDLSTPGERKAVQLGQAGRDLGGMDLDRWLADDFVRRHGLDEAARKRLEPVLLLGAERVKIALSDPVSNRAELELGLGDGEVLTSSYVRGCAECAKGRSASGSAPVPSRESVPCLGCLLLERGFSKSVRETLDRALENAAVKCGLRRSEVTRVVVTGGTSLVPAVRQLLEEAFEGRVSYESPFDAVACGASRGLVAPILQHDYAIESYNAARKVFEFKPLFAAGIEYPTEKDAVRFWARGSHDGMTRIGIQVFEVSQMTRRSLDVSMVDSSGALLDSSRVQGDRHHICLNRDNPTFIPADPPVSLARDQKRFLCSFHIDGNRRLCVTVLDNLTGKRLLEDHPVVRL